MSRRVAIYKSEFIVDELFPKRQYILFLNPTQHENIIVSLRTKGYMCVIVSFSAIIEKQKFVYNLLTLQIQPGKITLQGGMIYLGNEIFEYNLTPIPVIFTPSA